MFEPDLNIGRRTRRLRKIRDDDHRVWMFETDYNIEQRARQLRRKRNRKFRRFGGIELERVGTVSEEIMNKSSSNEPTISWKSRETSWPGMAKHEILWGMIILSMYSCFHRYKCSWWVLFSQLTYVNSFVSLLIKRSSSANFTSISCEVFYKRRIALAEFRYI